MSTGAIIGTIAGGIILLIAVIVIGVAIVSTRGGNK